MKVYAQIGNSDEYLSRVIEDVTIEKILDVFKVNLKKQTLMYQIRESDNTILFIKVSQAKDDLETFMEEIKGRSILYLKIVDIPVAANLSKKESEPNGFPVLALLLCLICSVVTFCAPYVGIVLSPVLIIFSDAVYMRYMQYLAPKSPISKTKYECEIKYLNAAGFSNNKKNKKLLKKYHGDIEKVKKKINK